MFHLRGESAILALADFGFLRTTAASNA